MRALRDAAERGERIRPATADYYSMNPDLYDNTWMSCGTSLLWEAEALNRTCSAEAVRSLREFLRLYQAGWPEDILALINNRTLVVAGLEAAMDTLHPDEAVEWLERKIYPAVLDFQENVADGGREAALILWLADRNRVFHCASENTYHWHCSGAHRKQSIPPNAYPSGLQERHRCSAWRNS